MIAYPQTLPKNMSISASHTLAQNESLFSVSINSSPAHAATEADGDTIAIHLNSSRNSNADSNPSSTSSNLHASMQKRLNYYKLNVKMSHKLKTKFKNKKRTVLDKPESRAFIIARMSHVPVLSHNSTSILRACFMNTL